VRSAAVPVADSCLLSPWRVKAHERRCEIGPDTVARVPFSCASLARGDIKAPCMWTAMLVTACILAEM
jgi:hypothetical protein